MRLALLFVPAAIAKFKPRDFAIDMYKEWMHVDNPRGTMHPTLFGDVFANFGFMCFLLGIVYGILVSFVDEFIKATKDPTMRCMKQVWSARCLFLLEEARHTTLYLTILLLDH